MDALTPAEMKRVKLVSIEHTGKGWQAQTVDGHGESLGEPSAVFEDRTILVGAVNKLFPHVAVHIAARDA